MCLLHLHVVNTVSSERCCPNLDGVRSWNTSVFTDLPTIFRASNPIVICLFCCLSFLNETLIVANSMDKGPSWKIASFSASPEIPRILWNQKVYCLVHKSQINSIHTSSYLFKTHFNIIPNLRLGIQSYLVSSRFPIKSLHAFLFPVRATCPTNPTALIWSPKK